MPDPKEIDIENTELAREIAMEEIERLKILIENLEKGEIAEELARERLEKLDTEIKKVENLEKLEIA